MLIKKFSIMVAFLLAFVMGVGLSYGAVSGSYEPTAAVNISQNSEIGEAGSDRIPKSFQKAAENGMFSLYAEKSSGEFAVLDRKTGSVWWSNPPDREEDSIAKGLQKMDLNSQLLLKFVDMNVRSESLLNTYTGSVKKNKAVYKSIENGFSIDYSFPQKKSRITLEIRLKDGYIEANVPLDKIKETKPDFFYSISILPFFGAGSSRDNGYMLVPDGQGALIYFNNKKQALEEYKQNIYGMDYTSNMLSRGGVEQDAVLPVFGASNGTCGYIAVVTGGDAYGTVNARVSGSKSSYNTVFCDFSIRTSDSKRIGSKRILVYNKEKVRLKNITIRYYLLSDGGCDYNAMASKYREYLKSELGLKEGKISEDMPLYIELYGAVPKSKNLLGMPYTATQPLADYESALDLLKMAGSKGINNIVFKYTNANKDNINGTNLYRFSPEAKLGSRRQLNELEEYCRGNNVVFAPNADIVHFKKGFLGISLFVNATRTITGKMAAQHKYKLSTDTVNVEKAESYLMTPARLPDKADSLSDSVKKLDFDSISLDTLGKMLYSDFYKGRTDRQEALEYMRNTAKGIAEKIDNIVMSNANAYMLPYAGYIEDSPQTSSRFGITDEDIPFYQLVLNGLISYSTPALNLGSDPGKAVLNALENGSSLKYTWITADPSMLIDTDYAELYATDYKAWFDSAVDNYNKLNEVYKKTAGSNIIHHRIISPGVREITYENGVCVVINYNSTAVTVDGKYKVEPEGYIIK